MKKHNIQGLAVFGMALTATGCVGNSSFEPVSRQRVSEALTSQPVASATATSTLEIRNTANTVLYQQTNPGSTLTLQRGYVYKACLQSPNTSTSVILKNNGVSIASGPSNQCYDLNLNGATPGNVPLELISSSPGMQTGMQKYTLSITCKESEVANMSAAQYVSDISVSLNDGASGNIYKYQPVGGNLGGAECAIDFNGDQIIDSEFKPCTQAQVGYSNHVGSRKLRIFVREKACNYPLSAVHTTTLSSAIPKNPPFIHAYVNQTDGKTAKPSLNLEHMSTNMQGQRAVTCGYANGVMSLQGNNKYAVRRGAGVHGMAITFKGLTGEVKDGNVAVTSSTRMSGFEFRTDHEIDVVGSQPLVFAGNEQNCTGTIEIQNLEIEGPPCDPKLSGTVKYKTILATGTFSCSNVTDSTGQHKISAGGGSRIASGAFSCSYAPMDACLPGGSSGGTPPNPF